MMSIIIDNFTLIFCLKCALAVDSPVVERVSGNIVEFEMSSLSPDTKYTVSVYATKDELKSQVATTEFTTGWCLIFIPTALQQPLFSWRRLRSWAE